MRTLFLPPAFQDSAESGRLILRDGSTAQIRPSEPSDRDALREFFQQLSTQSKKHRFFSSADPPEALIDQQCDSSDPTKRFTLIVSRAQGIIACGSYVARDETTAEVAFAVDDELQGKGLGGLLLERLALIGARYGFTRFWAVTQIENRLMLDTFQRSGFQMRSKVEDDYVEIDLSVSPSADSASRSELRDRVFTTASLRPFFEPRAGELAIIDAPHDQVLRAVDDCAAAGARALIVTTPDEDGALHDVLRNKVRGYGMRMLGPNSMGLMNTDPKVQLNATLFAKMPQAGSVAMSSQNAAVGMAMLALARQRNVGISSCVSVGDKADISGNDLLQYWQGDSATRIILLYLESFGNPRRFARIARAVSREKPIVVVKPGREAVVSALFRQTGVIRADGLEEMFDIVAALEVVDWTRWRPAGRYGIVPKPIAKVARYATWRAGPHGVIPDFDDLDLPTARTVCHDGIGKGWLSADDVRKVLKATGLRQCADVHMQEDPLFGPLIKTGNSIRITPLTDRAAAVMAPGLPAVQDVLLRVSRLVEEVPEIAELHIGDECHSAETRIRIHDELRRSRT
jgi:succinyl-CoA synthetase alpha subunit/N-acetylglutamate synthase-like GNAT family acetyltransferase